MKVTTVSQSIHQHTLGKSFLLHILPGILVTAVFVGLKPLADSAGYPPLLVFLLTVLLVDIPFMLGVMLVEGRRLTGRLSLDGVVVYRERTPWKTFALVFVGAFVLLYLLITVTTPINTWIAGNLFSWAPDWLFLDDASQYEGYTKNILVIVFTLQLLITGIILPWVEELYFRGYLLPRMSRYKAWAPLIGGFFFGLYHIWQLFGFLGVFLLGTGLAYIAWWKKDIRLNISLHVFANALMRVFLLISVMML